MALGETTWAEILSQPRCWKEALNVFGQQTSQLMSLWKSEAFDEVIFTGCGSTYYLGVIGATLVQAAADISARAFSATELMLFPQNYFSQNRKTLLVCVSRSGTTRETLEAARLFRQHTSGSVIIVTCHSESPLAQQADLLLAVDTAREESRVQTRSFSSMVVVITAMAALLGGQDLHTLDPLPDAARRLIERAESVVRPLGDDSSITQFVFLGSGAQYGLACEAMLKMTEMSRVFSVSYHILEYLHGPRYATDEHTLIVGLVSDSAFDEEVRALKLAAFRHARVLILADEERAALAEIGTVLPLSSGVPEASRTILYLPPLQLLGFYQAIQRGFDPDNLPFDPRDQASV